MASLFKKLSNVLRPKREDRDLVNIQNEIQSCLLTIQEKDRTIRALKDELTRQRETLAQYSEEILSSRQEKIITDLGVSVIYFQRQMYLLSNGQAVASNDIQSVVDQLSHKLEQNGVQWIGKCGEITTYHPDRHAPISSTSQYYQDQQVKIIFPGMTYNDTVIKKALVDILKAD